MRYARITGYATGSAPWYLGDDREGRGDGSQWLSENPGGFSRNTQDVEPLDASHSTPQSLGNTKGRQRFVVDYGFENSQAGIDACFLFKHRLALDCPAEGNLEVGVVGGGAVIYPNAVIESIEWEDGQDVAIKVTYNVKLGKPQTAPQA